MSGLFGSTVIKGTKITDFSSTSAEVGIPLPFGYGKFPVSGNVIWAPLPPVEHRQVKRQGKGGVKQETFTYTLSYAIAFCKGPISGFWWIKRNGKVVWTQDPNAPVEDQAYAAKWAQRVNFHYGTRTQMPDSVIESYEGAGNVSAFRYLAYITVEDEDVTDNGGAVPNYEACVIRGAARSYTTPPYPVYNEDNIQDGLHQRQASSMQMAYDETDTSIVMMDASRRFVKQEYSFYIPEEIETTLYMRDATRKAQLVRYQNYPFEAVDHNMQMRDATRKVVLIRYQNYPFEAADTSMQMRNATRTPV